MSNGILYPEKLSAIKRKVKILNRRAVAHKDAGKANKLRDKAEEWETLQRLNAYNSREQNV